MVGFVCVFVPLSEPAMDRAGFGCIRLVNKTDIMTSNVEDNNYDLRVGKMLYYITVL